MTFSPLCADLGDATCVPVVCGLRDRCSLTFGVTGASESLGCKFLHTCRREIMCFRCVRFAFRVLCHRARSRTFSVRAQAVQCKQPHIGLTAIHSWREFQPSIALADCETNSSTIIALPFLLHRVSVTFRRGAETLFSSHLERYNSKQARFHFTSRSPAIPP